MSWIADLLKDIPLSVVLKEKISLLEMKFADLENENAILREKNALLTQENTILKTQLLEAQQQNEVAEGKLRIDAESENLDENAIQVIRLLSQKGGTRSFWELEEQLQMPKIQLQFSLDFLEQHNFLESRFVSYTKPTTYELTQKGRKFALDNKLV